MHGHHAIMKTIRKLLLVASLCFLYIIKAQDAADSVIVELLDQDEIADESAPPVANETVTEKDNDDAVVNTTIVMDMDENDEETKEETITVKSNLELLADEELQAICAERGFEVSASGGQEMSHEDYVEAAKRCLSLENEMNAIIAENPDLAAELEVEIERMMAEKERLILERDAMIAEKDELEQKLRSAGIDPNDIVGSTRNSVNEVKEATPETYEEVLRQSFTMLWDNVGRDLRFVGKVVGYAMRPVAGGVGMIWRYTGPSVENALQKVITVAEGIMQVKQLQVAQRFVSKQLRTTWNFLRTHVTPLAQQARVKLVHGLEQLNQNEKIRKVVAIVGAVLGPLRESLMSGWSDAKPKIVKVQTRTSAWFQRVKNERQPQRVQ